MTFSYDHSKECEMFNFLRKAKDLDLSSDGSYLPFEDMAITTILKAITFDMTGSTVQSLIFVQLQNLILT